ncbi:hypothetical protein GCM10023200_48410 [Actinomycetospora chlora]|uniref:PAS domain-containing protein n=1 Tax=Actinomycetospora chlora TaxID=663608 RepID=A0ABP9C6F5_9PSEU
MITDNDLSPIPAGTARALLRVPRLAVGERAAAALADASLDRVERVALRLLARAALSEPEVRGALRSEADELDAAVRDTRAVLRGATPEPVHRPVETALLDPTGTIVWVNRAWDDFCVANGGDPASCGVGWSYLALCDEAGDPRSAEVAAAIRSALRGDLPAPARLEVPCPAPDRPRDFDVLVSSRRGDAGDVLGATVTLSEVVPVRA